MEDVDFGVLATAVNTAQLAEKSARAKALKLEKQLGVARGELEQAEDALGKAKAELTIALGISIPPLAVIENVPVGLPAPVPELEPVPQVPQAKPGVLKRLGNWVKTGKGEG